jgi:hypothetical protein
MERLRLAVVQLEEAKRFIVDGEVARLRLAVILLDKAVEVMLHRRVSEDLGSANMYGRMLQRFPDGPLDAKGEALRQEIAAKIIPPARQKKVARYFGEKLTLLSESGHLPFAMTRALRHLHDYRNELQHHDHVRPESSLPAALILFDIALDLMVTLEPGSTSWGERRRSPLVAGLRHGTLSHNRHDGTHRCRRSRVLRRRRCSPPIEILSVSRMQS